MLLRVRRWISAPGIQKLSMGILPCHSQSTPLTGAPREGQGTCIYLNVKIKTQFAIFYNDVMPKTICVVK